MDRGCIAGKIKYDRVEKIIYKNIQCIDSFNFEILFLQIINFRF
jgi:hypothetical protein